MNKKISLGAAIAFMLIVATATFSMTMIYANSSFNDKVNDLKEREVMFEKYSEIDRQVRANYYGTINETQLMDSVANGYLAGIGDKYSRYIDARTYERLTRTDEGNIVGVGAVFVSGADGYLEVTQVYSDSPAQTVGIEVGDLVVKVDDTDLTPENSSQMLDSINGEPGTRITLLVRRGAEENTFEMTRRSVIIPTVYSRFSEDTGVGYILIEEFSDNTSDQFNRELQRLIDQGAQSLVIDLRDNSGGVLRWAARILDRLLPAGVIASTTDRSGNQEVLYTSDTNEIDLPIVVVTNSGTASSAELFAQAIKDFGKGRSVGTATAGKGVVQEIIKLSDGSAIEVTVGELYSPSGETFNNVGVKPDYEVTLEGDWRDMDENTDAQLKKAFEVAVSMQKTMDAQSGEESDDSSQEEEQSEVSGGEQEESASYSPDDDFQMDDSSAEDGTGDDESSDDNDRESGDSNDEESQEE